MATGTLFIVATPIGNLKDISPRALEVLQNASLILAEDTRVTRKLLSHYRIHVPLDRYNEHDPQRAFLKARAVLVEGRHVALVSDAGTPGISDPGGVLTSLLRTDLPAIAVIPVPGPSALVAALSVSGLPANRFTFVGYPPLKKKRKSFFDLLTSVTICPIVLYESPHRMAKTLAELIRVFGGEHEVFIAREMTKVHEEHFRGTLFGALERFGEGKARGEFVIVLK